MCSLDVNMEVEVVKSTIAETSLKTPDPVKSKRESKALKQGCLPFMSLDVKSLPPRATKKRKLSCDSHIVISSKSPKTLRTSENQSPKLPSSKKRPLSANKAANEDEEVEVTSSSEAEAQAEKSSKYLKRNSLDLFVKPIDVREESISSTTEVPPVVEHSHVVVLDEKEVDKVKDGNESLNDSNQSDSSDVSTANDTLGTSSQEEEEKCKKKSLKTDTKKDINKNKTPKPKILSDEQLEKREERERERRKKHEELEKQKAEKEQKRKEEREKKEKAKEELKKEREQQKSEKQKAKDGERKKKQEFIDLKNEEKRKKEEEKRLEEERKKKQLEEVNKKKDEQKKHFSRFFVKGAKTSPPPKKTQGQSSGLFMPFEVKKDMKLAPAVRAQMTDFDQFEKLYESQESSSLYLDQLKSGEHKSKSSPKTWLTVEEDITCMEDDGLEPKRQAKFKLLKFCANHRPEYWGTWRKKSMKISPRNPLKQDKDLLDYEVDSDDEWEEEEPGESLSHSEGEEEKAEDDDDDDDGFFVPHGYLSEDELDGEDENLSPDAMKAQQKQKERQWEIEQKKALASTALKPILIGCLWADQPITEHLKKTLAQYQVCLLTKKPIMTSYTMPELRERSGHTPRDRESKSDETKSNSSLRRPVPQEAIPYLVELVHGNTLGILKIIKEFKQFWMQKVKGEEPTKQPGDAGDAMELDITPSPVSPPEGAPAAGNAKNGFISKRQLDLKIREIAAYGKQPRYARKCWYVNDATISEYKLGELIVSTQWKYVTNVAEKKAEPISNGRATPVAKATPGKSTPNNNHGNVGIKQFIVATPPCATSGVKMISPASNASPYVIMDTPTSANTEKVPASANSDKVPNKPGTPSTPFDIINTPKQRRVIPVTLGNSGGKICVPKSTKMPSSMPLDKKSIPSNSKRSPFCSVSAVPVRAINDSSPAANHSSTVNVETVDSKPGLSPFLQIRLVDVKKNSGEVSNTNYTTKDKMMGVEKTVFSNDSNDAIILD